MNKPSIRQLEYLLAIAKHNSFHKAAKACFVSQPTLSTQIKILESNLGIILFERNNRTVRITSAGQEIIYYAKIILNNVDILLQKSERLGLPLSNTLKLGVIPTISPYLLPKIMPAIRRKYPKLKLLIREAQTNVLLKKLHEGDLDILLLALEADLGNAHSSILFTDTFYCALYQGHPLEKKKSINANDLQNTSVLLLEEGHCLRDQVWDFCKQMGAHELGDFRATSLNTLAQMVSNQLGITLLPEIALQNEARHNPQILIKPFKAPIPFRTIGLAWNPLSSRKEEFLLLESTIKKAMA